MYDKLKDIFTSNVAKPDRKIEDVQTVEVGFRNGIGYDSNALRDRAKGLVGRY